MNNLEYPVERQLQRGEQVARIPLHVRENGDDWLSHSDTEFGFVWEDEGDTLLCRYFSKYDGAVLRTRANSERCNREDIVAHISRDVYIIDYWLKVINREGDHSIPRVWVNP